MLWLLACVAPATHPGDAPPADSATTWSDSGQHASDSAESGLPASYPVFTPPSDASDQLGVYHWDPDLGAWPGTPDVLTWGADSAAAMGARTLRLTLSARDDYDGANLGNVALVDIAASENWAPVLANPSFDTVLLTTYTEADIESVWSDGYWADEATAERDAIAALGTWLLTNAPGRTFILLNWEGDNAMASWKGDAVAWQGYRDWVEARVEGVEAARAAVPDSTARLYSGLEFNAVDDLQTGEACGSAPLDCVLSEVAPTARVDVYSYSSWQTAAFDVPDDQLAAHVSDALDRIDAALAASHPDLARQDILIGEYGAGRDIYDECRDATRSAAIGTAALDWGAGLAIHWQLYDNPGVQTVYGFGLMDRDGRRTLSGDWLANWWATGLAVDIPDSCGSINDGGICDGTTWDDQIIPGDAISIFGSGFSTTGNTVHFDADGALSTAGAGTPWWYESEGQINVTLPTSIGPATGLRVWVSSPQGYESNTGRINVLAP